MMKHRTDIDGLSEAERAFEIEGGKQAGRVVTVRLTRLEEEGAEDLPTVNVKTVAVLIDPDTGEPVEQDGTPVRTAPKVRSVSVSALDEGEVSMTGEIAEATREAVGRMKKHLSAMEAWAQLPTEEES